MGAPLGHIKWGGRKKGTKNKETLRQEQRRQVFEEKVTQVWEQVIENLPPTYIADQFLGKAPDKIEHSGEIKTDPTLTPELIEIAKEELKKRLTKSE